MFVIHPALISIADTMNLIFEKAYSGLDIRVDGLCIVVHTFTIFYFIYLKAYRGRKKRKLRVLGIKKHMSAVGAPHPPDLLVS